MSAEPSIFTLIIRGQIPSHKVYEDDHVFALLDINPFSPGHTLVVPKEAAVTVDAMSEESAAALGRALPRICRAILAATGVDSYNIVQNNGESAGQTVDHVHFHIIPKHRDGRGLSFSINSSSLSEEDGAEMAERIRSHL
jgi:histidine triad (HIT) family protein